MKQKILKLFSFKQEDNKLQDKLQECFELFKYKPFEDGQKVRIAIFANLEQANKFLNDKKDFYEYKMGHYKFDLQKNSININKLKPEDKVYYELWLEDKYEYSNFFIDIYADFETANAELLSKRKSNVGDLTSYDLCKHQVEIFFD